MKLYSNLNKNDGIVYVCEDDDLVIESNFALINTIYHVTDVTDDEDSEYDYEVRGRLFLFTSEAGRQAYEKHNGVTRTKNPKAVSCPDCLIALGLEDRLVYFEAEKSSKPEPAPTSKE